MNGALDGVGMSSGSLAPGSSTMKSVIDGKGRIASGSLRCSNSAAAGAAAVTGDCAGAGAATGDS